MALEVGSAVFRTAGPSLAKLLKYEWGLNKTVKQGLTSLEAEHRGMQAFLEDVSGMPPDQLSRQVKLWADEVRELCNSMEKHLHSFMARIESSKGGPLSAPVSAVSKHFINHEIANYIKETWVKVKEVRERYGPYPSKSSMESTPMRTVDPRIFAMYTKETDLVGLAGATDELTKMLSKGDHVSIVGIGGLGKTTLARVVLYDKMNGEFDCRAFVPAGRSARAENVLKDIFYELGIDIYGGAPNERQLMEQLQKFLVDKRCFIVIDDLWDMETWKFIKCAFAGSAESKIITTTRKLEVAKKVGGVYMMKPLSPANSVELLQTKIFGSEVKTDDSKFAGVSNKILSKCGGVPIAIITIASLLATKPRDEWSKVYDSIGFGEHEKEDVVKDIRMILSFSYYDLPYHLQRCFLYLSLFPEDHWIEKNMLIWRWVAEGLVVPGCSEHGVGLFELGKRYFDELIEKSMIQLAVSPRDIGQGGCRIHDMMLDLVRNLSSHENFSTLLGRKQEGTSATSPVQRLAIHKTSVDQIQSTSMEVGEVLSLYANTCPGSSLPSLSKFAWLRVIDLEGCDLSIGDCKLKHLEKLDELAYVGLLGTPVAKLPKKIGRRNALQTLDVTATGIRELPPFVGEQTNLRCLRAGKGTRMVSRVGKLTSLEELWLHSADMSPDFAAEVKKLTALRVLVIHFDKMDEDLHKALVESLHVLKKLQVLQIWSDAEGKVRLGGWEGDTPFPDLRQLLLFGVSLPRLASWICSSYVPKLSKLLLEVEVLKAQDLKILGQMSSLHSLYLHSKDNSLSYTASKDEFKVLEYLNTNIELVCGDGALPRIQELEIGGIRVGTDVGLQGNMPLLERASYHLDCIGCMLVDIEKAEAVLRQASQAHPNNPTLSIKRFNNYKVELEEQHRFIESAAPEFLSTLALAYSDPGGILGVDGGGEAQTNGFANVRDIIARFKSSVGEPHILTMGDATDGTGSPSQSAGGVPPIRPNGAGQVTSSTCQSVEPKAQFSTDGLLADLKGQSAANLASTLAAQVGTEPRVVMGMLEKWSRSPEIVATMNSIEWDASGPMSTSDISTMVHLMVPEIISQLGGLPGRGSARDSTTPTVELSDKSFNFDAGSQVDRADSLIADDAVSARTGIRLANNAVPGITAKDAAADARKSLTESIQNTETVACLKSFRNAGGSGSSASDKSKLGKLMMPDLISTKEQKTDGPGRGQGAEPNLPGKHPAENSGTSVNREQTPKAPCMHTQADGVFSWLNSQNGADFSSKVVDQLSQNPEMIASINSAVQNGDILGMVPGLLSNPAFGSLLENLAVASSYATMAQGVVAAPESSPDGENSSRMFNLKEQLSNLATGASSGQPSSAQVRLMSSMAQKTEEPGMGQAANFAENSGASVSREPTPNVPTMHTQVDNVFSRLNNPDLANFSSKAVDQFNLNPEMIDGINSIVRKGDFPGMLPGLLSNPAIGSLLQNLIAQASFTDVRASSNATVARGLAAATENNQDGENFLRMFNLKEQLPALEQTLAACESSRQPRSKSDNVGIEEGGPE